MDSDTIKMIEYIEKHLNNHPEWFKDYRGLYLDICRKAQRFQQISEKQKDVLVIAYNKIFDKASPLDNCQDLPFGG